MAVSPKSLKALKDRLPGKLAPKKPAKQGANKAAGKPPVKKTAPKQAAPKKPASARPAKQPARPLYRPSRRPAPPSAADQARFAESARALGLKPARRRRPWLRRLIIAAVIIVVLVLAGIGIYIGVNIYVSGGVASIGLNAQTTRTAIDDSLPALPRLIASGSPINSQSLGVNSQDLYAPLRYVPDLGAKKASGSQLVYMPVALPDQSFLDGYYEGGYSAYSASELQEYFNGAYVIDSNSDSRGKTYTLSYANLSSQGIPQELEYLSQKEGLADYKQNVKQTGNDSEGYLCQRGTIKLGKKTYYYQLRVADFSKVYKAQILTTPAVYAEFELGTYNFCKGKSALV